MAILLGADRGEDAAGCSCADAVGPGADGVEGEADCFGRDRVGGGCDSGSRQATLGWRCLDASAGDEVTGLVADGGVGVPECSACVRSSAWCVRESLCQGGEDFGPDVRAGAGDVGVGRVMGGGVAGGGADGREVGLAKRAGCAQRGLAIDVADAVVDWIGELGYDLERGARPLKRVVAEQIATAVARSFAGPADAMRDAVIRIRKHDRGVVVDRVKRS